MIELTKLGDEARACTSCGELAQKRTHVVFGEGAAPADLMLVGEAPGTADDLEGRPFTGDRGGVIDELLKVIDRRRDDVFVTNLLLCRTPSNRNPKHAEITACSRFLYAQAKLVDPRVIVSFGALVSRLLTGSTKSMTGMHGHECEVRIGRKLVLVYPIFEPTQLLYAPAMRRHYVKAFARVPELLERELDDAWDDQAEPDPEQLGLFPTGRLLEGV